MSPLLNGRLRLQVALLDPRGVVEEAVATARAAASGTRPTRGLGPGLSVARGLVELHDGELFADSPGPGLGSTFTGRLPLSSHLSAEPPAPSPASPVLAAAAVPALVALETRPREGGAA